MRTPLQMLLVACLWVCSGCATSVQADVSADVSIAATASDEQPRILHRASLLADGRVMVTGGLGLTLIPPSLFSRDEVAFFDPVMEQFTDEFTPGNGNPPTTPLLNTARSGHTQTTLDDGRVLITGGRINATGTSDGTRTSSVEIFDPMTGQFTVADSMTHARSAHTATMLADGRVLIAGGDAAGTWQLFDPATDQWSSAFELEHTRSAHAAVLLPSAGARGTAGERVLLIAGAGSGPATLEVIDVDAQSSSLLTSTLAEGLDDVAAVRVPDGRTILIGGQRVATGDTTDACYWIDIDADTITEAPAAPDRPGGIADHSAIGLGRFIVVLGGEQQLDSEDTELDYLAIFDAHANAWVYSGVMNAPHDDAPAMLLNDGRILVIGGGVPFLGQELPTAACELILVSCNADGDLTADCSVGLADLLAVLSSWGCTGTPARSGCSCSADASGDCTVGLADLLIVLSNWGA